ncbi:hypothetical protein U1Q18_000972 [Sarracenia purpurea var. burkii]
MTWAISVQRRVRSDQRRRVKCSQSAVKPLDLLLVKRSGEASDGEDCQSDPVQSQQGVLDWGSWNGAVAGADGEEQRSNGSCRGFTQSGIWKPTGLESFDPVYESHQSPRTSPSKSSTQLSNSHPDPARDRRQCHFPDLRSRFEASSADATDSFFPDSDRKGEVIGLGICGFFLVLVIGFWGYREANLLKKKKKKLGRGEEEVELGRVGKRFLRKETNLDFVADVSDCLDKYKVYEIEELREATDGFDEKWLIQDSVYKGCINGGFQAIKIQEDEVECL